MGIGGAPHPQGLEVLDWVVGVDDHSDFPPEVQGLPRVGPDLGVDLDRVEALRPDLVLASLLGVPERGQEVVAGMRRALGEARASLPPWSRPQRPLELVDGPCGDQDRAPRPYPPPAKLHLGHPFPPQHVDPLVPGPVVVPGLAATRAHRQNRAQGGSAQGLGRKGPALGHLREGVAQEQGGALPRYSPGPAGAAAPCDAGDPLSFYRRVIQRAFGPSPRGSGPPPRWPQSPARSGSPG